MTVVRFCVMAVRTRHIHMQRSFRFLSETTKDVLAKRPTSVKWTCQGNVISQGAQIFPDWHPLSGLFHSGYSDSQAFTLTSENDKIHLMYGYTDCIPDSKSPDSGTFYFVFTHLRENGKNPVTECSRFVTNPPPPLPSYRQKKNPVVLT